MRSVSVYINMYNLYRLRKIKLCIEIGWIKSLSIGWPENIEIPTMIVTKQNIVLSRDLRQWFARGKKEPHVSAKVSLYFKQCYSSVSSR